MTELRFTVRFHAPFLIGSGQSGAGLDDTSRNRPLPAESLKGAMRAAARVLDVPSPTISEIYGQPGSVTKTTGQGAWSWTDAGPDEAFERHSRSRNRVDPATGTVHPQALVFTEEIWQRPGTIVTFAVEPLHALTPDRATAHSAVLIACGYAVTGLGQWRNRGMGAVTIRPTQAVDPKEVAARLEAVTRA